MQDAIIAWENILNIVTTTPQDVPTVIQKTGSFGCWFHAIGNGKNILIKEAISNLPSCHPAKNAKIEKSQFLRLYPNYTPWRRGTLDRENAKAGTFISSYAFGLINKFLF